MRYSQFVAAERQAERMKTSVRSMLSVTPALIAILDSGAALAQTAQAQTAQAQTTQAQATEEIVITGTHIVRDGFEAPTPVSVVSVEQMQSSATGNVADYLNTLPALGSSMTPTTNMSDLKNAMVGINSLNLRALGASRTLVLMDGQRVGPSTNTGVVDINTIPQQLIARVDVVTGGASSTYGSDALSGVVNFVMDNKFVGVKGEASAGVTTYGDDRSWKIALTGGATFGGDRGHFIVSGEVTSEDGVLSSARPWQYRGISFLVNPSYTATNGQPQNLLLTQVGSSNAAPGGIITGGPLKGVAFGPGGTPFNFVYGSIVRDPYMSGGSWASAYARVGGGADIAPAQTRQNIFTRVSYQVADDWEVFGQASWAHTNSSNLVTTLRYEGNLTMKTDNAFLPTAIAAQAAAQKITSFAFGTYNSDIPEAGQRSDRRYMRGIVGVNGKFDAFGTTWTTSAYFQASLSKLKSGGFNIMDKTNYALAIDAVRAPNGSIVCRSSLTNPANGCVPFNVFGTRVNSQAAISYVTGGPYQDLKNVENVGAINVSGTPFSNWAGEISTAFGIESRRETGSGIYGPLADVTRWYFGAGLPAIGKFSVTEGYLETVVPLAKDMVWAKNLDLNGAVRVTGYGSGTVATWKVGVEYAPIDDVRFRVTRSYDIREPSIVDLYAGGTISLNSVNDPFDGGKLVANQTQATGNPNLVPEKANAVGVGVVVQPSFFPGLSASIDYYDIKIADGIGSLSIQQTVDLCYQGNQAICNLVVQGTLNGAHTISLVKSAPVNLASERARGFDIEASYRIDLAEIDTAWDGKVTVRALATRALTDVIASGIPGSIATELVGMVGGPSGGSSGQPRWRYETAINYNTDTLGLALTLRGVSKGVYNNNYIECTSGCPASTTNHPTYSSTTIAGAHYFDFGMTYKLNFPAVAPQLFLNVRNVFNTDPVPYANSIYATNGAASYYDVLGRVFRAGIRFQM